MGPGTRVLGPPWVLGAIWSWDPWNFNRIGLNPSRSHELAMKSLAMFSYLAEAKTLRTCAHLVHVHTFHMRIRRGGFWKRCLGEKHP
jgi:hypothetical protein